LAELHEAEVTFPSFENQLDAPAQAVNPEQGFGRPGGGGDIGEDNVPAQEEESFRAGLEALVPVLAGAPRTVTGNEPLSQFLSSVRRIERQTGLNFYPELPKEVQERLETGKAERLW